MIVPTQPLYTPHNTDLLWQALNSPRLRKRILLDPAYGLAQSLKTKKQSYQEGILKLGAAATANAIRLIIERTHLTTLINEIGKDAWQFALYNSIASGLAALPRKGLRKKCLSQYGDAIFMQWQQGDPTDHALDPIIRAAMAINE